MGKDLELPDQRDTRDLISIIREKSMRDVLTLSIKRGALGGYKAEDVAAYAKTVMDRWSICEKNYNDYIKDLYSQIEQLKGERLKTDYSSVQSAVADQSASVDPQETLQLNDLLTALESMQAQEEILRNRIDELEKAAIPPPPDTAQEQELEQRFALFQDEVLSQIDELSQQNTTLSNQLRAAQNSLQIVSEQFQAQAPELDQLRLDNDRLKTNQSSAAQWESADPKETLQLNDLLTALEGLQAQETKLFEKIDELEAEKANLQHTIDDLKLENGNLNSESETLVGQYAQLQDDLSDLIDKTSELLHINEVLTAQKADLSDRLNVFHAENAGLQSANESLQEQIAQQQDLNAENKQAKRQVEELNTQIAALENAHNFAKTQSQLLQTQLEEGALVNVELKNALDAAELAAKENVQLQSDTLLVSLAQSNKELVCTIKELDLQNKELHYQLNSIKESFQKVLHLESRKQMENKQLQQLLTIERSRVRQLIRENWKTGIWNEIDSMLM